MLKVLFPFRVSIADCDGVMRNCANLADVVELAKEKAERYNDDEAKRFVAEIEAAESQATLIKETPAALVVGKAPAKGKGVKALIPDSSTVGDAGEEEETPPPAERGTAKASRAPAKVAAKKAAPVKKPAAKAPATKAAAKPARKR